MPEDAEQALQKLHMAEKEVRSHDGRFYLLRVLPYRTKEDRISGVVVTFIDITQRKKVEDKLRHSEERMRLLIESAKDYAIFTINAQRHIVSWSTGAEMLLGYTEKEIIGQLGDIIFPLEDCESGIPAQEAEIAGKEGRAENERLHIRKDGSLFWGSGITSPLRDGGGKLIGFVKIMRDLTEQRQAQDAMAADLESTMLLRDLSAQIVTEDDVQVLYDKIMHTAIALTHADAGTVQMLDKDRNYLELLAAEGFPQAMMAFFNRVNAASATSCGNTLTTGVRCVMCYDEPGVTDRDGVLRMHVEAGFLTGQSTPLITRSGKLIGVMSTHWREHNHHPTERELRYNDLLARQAADVIEHRRSERALREAEEKYRTQLEQDVAERTADLNATKKILQATLDSSLYMIQAFQALRDKTGIIVDFIWVMNNRTAIEQTGNVTGKSLREQNPGVIPSGLFQDFVAVTETGVSVDKELYYDYEQFRGWFHLTIVKMGDGFVVNAEDITEKKITEETARKFEAQFRLFVTISSDIVYKMSADWTKMYNLVGKDFLADTSESTDTWLEKYIPAEAQQQVNTVIETAIQNKSVFEHAHLVIRTDGSFGWVYSRAIPIFNEQGEIVEWFGTAQNITDQKRAE